MERNDTTLHWPVRLVREAGALRSAGFAALLLCIALPAFFALAPDRPTALALALLPMGLGAAAVFARKAAPRAKAVLPVLCAVAALTLLLALALAWALAAPFSIMPVLLAMKFACAGAFLAGAFGLVMGCVQDRRWLSVYVLCLTVIVLGCVAFTVLCDMTLTSLRDISRPLLLAGACAGALGLAGTGWLYGRKS